MSTRTGQPYCFKYVALMGKVSMVSKSIFSPPSAKNAITGINSKMFIALKSVAASILFFANATIANVETGEISAKTNEITVI